MHSPFHLLHVRRLSLSSPRLWSPGREEADSTPMLRWLLLLRLQLLLLWLQLLLLLRCLLWLLM